MSIRDSGPAIPLSIAIGHVVVTGSSFDSATSVELTWPGSEVVWIGRAEGTATIYTVLELVDTAESAQSLIGLRWAEPNPPVLALGGSMGDLWAASGCEIAVIEIARRTIHARCALTWEIDGLLTADADVIAMTEVGAVRVSRDGAVLWEYLPGESVERWYRTDSELVLAGAGTEEVHLDMRSGELRGTPSLSVLFEPESKPRSGRPATRSKPQAGGFRHIRLPVVLDAAALAVPATYEPHCC
jgi:hypothetical protein